MTLVWNTVFMLLRGVGPHLHPLTESSGVVWGRPSPPALDSSRRGAMCRSRRGACRGRRCPLEPWPPVDRAPRSNSPAPAGCCASKSTNAERAMAVRLARTGAGPVATRAQSQMRMLRRAQNEMFTFEIDSEIALVGSTLGTLGHPVELFEE